MSNETLPANITWVTIALMELFTLNGNDTLTIHYSHDIDISQRCAHNVPDIITIFAVAAAAAAAASPRIFVDVSFLPCSASSCALVVH